MHPARTCAVQELADGGWHMFFHPVWELSELLACQQAAKASSVLSQSKQFIARLPPDEVRDRYLVYGGLPGMVRMLRPWLCG